MDQSIEIHKLASERLQDWLDYFDHDAFSDNPHWASCYCMFYLNDPKRTPWETRTAQDNRFEAIQRIQSHRMHGYLAYQNGKMVGWCHAAPLSQLPNFEDPLGRPAAELAKIGVILCFNVFKELRRQGVARALLETACLGLQEQGISIAEATPRVDTDAESSNYHGPLAMYQAAGFEVVGTEGQFALVRKELDRIYS
jgi:ribosomal protein S18 acetylase RimI-like enzyme